MEGKRGAYYWIEGQPYVSVTEVLKVLDKPALMRWYGKQVYLAMLANPSLSEKDALSAPYAISDSAKARGSTVHSIIEAYKQTQEYIDGVAEPYRGYAQAFYQWTKDNHVTIVEHERTVVSKKFGYAGRLDLLVQLNGSPQLIVADCKTGKDIYPEAFLQLSAYRQALSEDGIVADGIAVLLLQEDGSYKYQLCQTDYLIEFRAAKRLWEWLNSDELKQLRRHAQKRRSA